MSRLYKRGGVWWASYKDASGRPHRRSLHTDSKAVARQRLRVAELADTNRAADKPLGDALTYLLDTVYAGRKPGTVESYRQKARHLARVFGDGRAVGSIDREAWHEYRAQRLREGAKDHSVHKEAVVLRLALREQGIDGVVPRVSASYQPRERYLTAEQFEGVFRALDPGRRTWLMLAVFLGARDSEIESLRWEDVDLGRGLVRVRGTKTRRSNRVVPIPAQLLSWLAGVPAEDRTGPLAAKWTNRRRDLTAAYWQVVGYTPPPSWQRGGKDKAGQPRSIKGAPRISPNDLRRTFASWLKQRGADSQAVAELLGHASTRMVESVYGRLNEDAFRRTTALLSEPLPDGSVRDLYRNQPAPAPQNRAEPHSRRPRRK